MKTQELDLIREIVDSPTGHEVIGQMPASDVCTWLGALVTDLDAERARADAATAEVVRLRTMIRLL
jgi:hypothetical protein